MSEIMLGTIKKAMLQQLRPMVSNVCFETWFKDLDFDTVDGAVRVIAPNRHVKDWVETHYRRELTQAAEQVAPDCRTLRFEARTITRIMSSASTPTLGQALPASSPVPSRSQTSDAGCLGFEARPHGTPLSPSLRLDRFSVGSSNRVAHSAAQAVAESATAVYNPLYIHGTSGTGKTHLLHGIGHALAAKTPGLRIIYISCEEFTNAYIRALQNKRIDAFRTRFRNCDVLLLDDVHFLTGRAKTQEELLYTFDALRNAGKQVVLCANAAPREIKGLDATVVARMVSGLVVRMEMPDLELRTALMCAKAKERGCDLPQDAAEVLAQHIDKSVRELEGGVCKLMALAAAERRPINKDLALVALRELGYLRSGPLSLPDILQALTQQFEVSADDVRSSQRHARVVHVRHMGMYLSKMLTSHSVVDIGRFYGNRDHATVLHAVRKITERVKQDENLKREIALIRQLLGR